jgi:SulP family sulfate permease
VDESLFFANASYLEDQVFKQIYYNDTITHVVLMCSAVNEIDYSALEVLEELNRQLREQGLLLHLSEVKGPVLDKTARHRIYGTSHWLHLPVPASGVFRSLQTLSI